MLQTLQSFDLWLFHVLTPVQSSSMDTVMVWISASGNGSTIWVTLALIALTRPSSGAAAWRVLLAVGLAHLLVGAVLKPAIARPRPASILTAAVPRELPPMPRSLSFPSGHAAAAGSAAIAVSRMWPAGRLVWWTMAVLIGYSRIYLGHHYPLDVAGGAIVGMLCTLWVLGGQHPSTYANTLPKPLPAGTIVRP